MNVSQKAFLAGEVAPALYARTDAQRYAFALRTCRNMVVMPGGGVTKRGGTAYVLRLLGGPLTITIAPLALSLLAGGIGGGVGFESTKTLTAVVRNGSGEVVPGLTVTWEIDDPSTATIASASPLTAHVTGLVIGLTAVRARIVGLGVVSGDCTIGVYDDYVLHMFPAGSGAFIVASGLGEARATIVAGGGSGGSVDGGGVGAGGGGGGGVILRNAISIAPGTYPVVVGGGGIHNIADHTIGGGVFGAVPGNNGTDSSFAGHTAIGGGGGGGSDATLQRQGKAGGSGGGGASAHDGPTGNYNGGAGTPGQGNNGENGSDSNEITGARGGGAGGAHGVGKEDDITGSAVVYAKGGDALLGAGVTAGAAGSGNGGEGGGQALNAQGTDGGSGVVLVRYLRSTGIIATGGTKTDFPA